MTDQQSCGKGLAGRAPLPGRLSELAQAMADVLEHHTTAIDLTDEHGKLENEAYASLVRQQREIASKLGAVADEMAGYRDLPTARHDMEALASSAAVDVFTKFVEVEERLTELLAEMLDGDRRMLETMRGGSTPPR